jgi:hypothetical protein
VFRYDDTTRTVTFRGIGGALVIFGIGAIFYTFVFRAWDAILDWLE